MTKFRQTMLLLYAALLYLAAFSNIILDQGVPGTLTTSGKLSLATRFEAYLGVVLVVMAILVMHDFYCLLRNGKTALETKFKPKGGQQAQFWIVVVVGLIVGLVWPVSLFIWLTVWMGRLFPRIYGLAGFSAPSGANTTGGPG